MVVEVTVLVVSSFAAAAVAALRAARRRKARILVEKDSWIDRQTTGMVGWLITPGRRAR